MQDRKACGGHLFEGKRREKSLKGKLGPDCEGSSITHFFFFLNKFIYYFWLRWVLVAARGLSLVAASGDYSSLRCAGFSLRWLLLLWSTGSRHTGFSSCASRALERRLSSCGTWAYLLRGMWDLPGPGLKPVSPALAGRFLTTAPPGKPVEGLLNHDRGADLVLQEQEISEIF